MFHRRRFLTTIAAPVAVPALASLAQTGPAGMKIASVEMWRLEGKREAITGVDRQHQVQPLHIYEEHRPKPYREPAGGQRRIIPVSALYLKIKTESGLEGIYGPIDREGAIVIDQQLKNFLIGKNALAVETIWDQMHRSNRHSRASHYMIGLSAIDNCLWDLRGRFYNTPVYRLLGGPTRDQVEAYGSTLGHSVEPEFVQKRCVEFAQQGFRHQKWFLAYGPGDGTAGLRKNVQLVSTLRESLGDEVEIMFDAFQGWNLDYAIAWAKQVERFRPRWIEEAFHMDKLESFVKLRQATSVPVATGEHMYGRWEAHKFLDAAAITVVQADPEWCGGVSELIKICTIASAYDAQVVPHGHSLHSALHVVASQSPMTCPLVEYLIGKMSSYYFFEKHDLQPVNGKIALPERPGFGVELDSAKMEKQTLVKWS
jgi:L-alanine-DL-glutamate epimerase-like enolase superfamily enzyme